MIETLPADQEINGINFKKGRLLVYCHDLARVHEDPDRRSFVLESTLRAVEARMVRRIGVVLEDARSGGRGGGAGRGGLLGRLLHEVRELRGARHRPGGCPPGMPA